MIKNEIETARRFVMRLDIYLSRLAVPRRSAKEGENKRERRLEGRRVGKEASRDWRCAISSAGKEGKR